MKKNFSQAVNLSPSNMTFSSIASSTTQSKSVIGQQGLHDNKHHPFSFGDYHKKKFDLQRKFQKSFEKNSENSRKWEFKHSCLLSVSDKKYKPYQAFESIKNALLSDQDSSLIKS
jgi:hypothetical protein